MDFLHYTDRPVMLAQDLANLFDGPVDAEQFLGFLREYDFDVTSIGDAELEEGRHLSNRLRAVFRASSELEKVDLLNQLLAHAKVEPRLSTHGDRGPHFHYTREDLPIVTRLEAFAAMGLAMVVAMHDHERLGTCAADDCDDAFVDTSRNATKRFCTGTCANRTNVAAYRRRHSEG